jgi:hypothetical protein
VFCEQAHSGLGWPGVWAGTGLCWRLARVRTGLSRAGGWAWAGEEPGLEAGAGWMLGWTMGWVSAGLEAGVVARLRDGLGLCWMLWLGLI